MLGVTSSLLLFCFWTVVAYVISYRWKRRHLYAAASKMVGPPTVPIFGNALMFMCKNDEILWRIHNAIAEYSPGPIRFWLGSLLLVLVPDTKHVEKILTSSKFINKFRGIYKFPQIILGEGLITGNGPHIKSDRKVIQRMLDLNFIQNSLDILNTHIGICMKNMERKVDGSSFNIFHHIHPCIADYIKEVILGSKDRSQVTGTSEFDQSMLDAYELIFTRIAKAWQHVDFIFNLSPNKEKQDRIRKIIRRIGKVMMVDAFKRRKTPNTDQFHAIIDSMADYADEHPNFFTEERFIDQILTLYAAAEDTISQITAFFAVCMGMYPEYQEKAAQEVRDLFGDTPRPVTPEDVPKLKFITMCLKEVLRLYPIGPFIARYCPEDFQLDDWVIPKGAALVVCTFSLQRNPDHWEKPNTFYPEHFLPEAEAKRPYYAYIPFSVGQRGCIGKTMAMYALKVFACNLLQRFEFEAEGKVETFKIKTDISVRPLDACRVKIKKRVWK